MVKEQRHHLEERANKKKSTIEEDNLSDNYSKKSLSKFNLTKLCKDPITANLF